MYTSQSPLGLLSVWRLKPVCGRRVHTVKERVLCAETLAHLVLSAPFVCMWVFVLYIHAHIRQCVYCLSWQEFFTKHCFLSKAEPC